MESSPKTLKIFNLAFLLFGLYALYCFWMIASEEAQGWQILYTIGVLAFFACYWGLIRQKVWGLYLSYAFIVVALGFGVYIVHFVWTFWIFEKPTITERILSALHPRVSIFVIFPVIWLTFFTRRGNIKKFTAAVLILAFLFTPALAGADPLTLEQAQRAAEKAHKQQAKSLKQGEKEARKKKRLAEKRTLQMQKKAAKRNAQLKKQIEETGM